MKEERKSRIQLLTVGRILAQSLVGTFFLNKLTLNSILTF